MLPTAFQYYHKKTDGKNKVTNSSREEYIHREKVSKDSTAAMPAEERIQQVRNF